MSRRAFTLIELLVVIAIIALLSSVVLASLNGARDKGRDAFRLVQAKQIQSALDIYFDQFGQFPPGVSDASCTNGGWDTTGDGTFIPALNSSGLMRTDAIKDIVNPLTNCGNFQYFRYPAGASGCATSSGYFYVLGITQMDTDTGTHKNSPGFSCPSRNWQTEYDWVAGKFEK